MAAVLTCTPCAAQRAKYQLTGVQRSRILIDARYDKAKDPKAVEFLAPHKHIVDSIMTPVVAQSDHYMAAHRPESDLSNLLADILVWAAKGYNEKVDFAVYNMGGIRAALPKGNVTVGDVHRLKTKYASSRLVARRCWNCSSRLPIQVAKALAKECCWV